jgi:hypothetical protein
MIIYDIKRLVRDVIQDNLYNLFEPTFKSRTGFQMQTYLVSKSDEMRIDVISNEIYGTPDECDVLLSINDIDNPLNIKEGDSIMYVNYETLQEYRIETIDNKEATDRLLNANKSTRKDPNRKNYVESGLVLTPTVQEVPQPPVKIENTQIVIGG